MCCSFNAREFIRSHGAPLLRTVKWFFLVATFALPALMVAAGSPAWLAATFVVRLAGLLAERWLFFAQASHPQKLSYQVIR
jgi:DMSO reductase anchor subunit